MAGGNNPAGNRPGWQNSRPNNGKGQRNPQPRISVRFSEITQYEQERFPSGYGEFDRVLGGGIVPGSLVLIGGDPGIGKSTLLLQVTNQLAQRLPRILYVSAEESGQQIKLRAARLGVGVVPVESEKKPLNQPQNSIIISMFCQKPI
jgi:DNA repair protein RadA/Sms